MGSDIKMPSATPSKSETSASAFEKLDSAHRGFVTKEDTAKLDGFDKSFERADANHDGKVSRDEFARVSQLFDSLDKNHDGTLTAEELGGFYLVAGQAPAQATGGVDVDNLFAKYDKNKDGKISGDELDNEKLFKALDLNHDGVITREEADRALRDLAARAKQKKESGK